MKKSIMASVLLASMALTVPAFAESDRTPDEYNPDERYESPLDQSNRTIVNERRADQATADSDAFEEAARHLGEGSASGRSAADVLNSGNDRGSISEVSDPDVPGTVDKKSERKNTAEASRREKERALLAKTQKTAEEMLQQTDDDFEPALEEEYSGSEYQARRQIRMLSDSDRDASGKTVGTKETAANDRGAAQTGVTGNQGKAKNSQKVPLIITGEDAQYANDSGDFIIEGNVRLRQGQTRLFSTKAVGNANTGDVWLLEGGTLQEPTNRMTAHWAHYNFNKETGELLYIKGASRPSPDSTKYDYYEAPHGLVENGMLIIDQGGTTTRCPAVRHPSCLSVKAKTITIIPNDRIIARGVQVFVKGKHIYSRDVWVNDLQASKDSLMPHVGWNNDKGWYVSLDYEQPIGNPLLKNQTKFYMHQVYYTKSKYKPFYGIRHDEHDFYVRLHDGYVYDSDDDNIDGGRWLRKKMDWGLFLKPHRVAKGIPLTYDASVTHGLWKYSHQSESSWHTEKIVRLRHDRIYPLGGKKLYLDLMVGRKWIRESVDNRSTRRYGKNLNTNIYHGTLGYKFSNKWNIWATYHDEHKTDYVFTLGQPSFAKEWRTGISWRPDDHNTFTVVNRHNSDSGSSSHGNYSTTYTWSHRFCCEVLSVSYQKKHYKKGEHEWTVKFDFLNW